MPRLEFTLTTKRQSTNVVQRQAAARELAFMAYDHRKTRALIAGHRRPRPNCVLYLSLAGGE
jgi:hypothetical protein